MPPRPANCFSGPSLPRPHPLLPPLTPSPPLPPLFSSLSLITRSIHLCRPPPPCHYPHSHHPLLTLSDPHSRAPLPPPLLLPTPSPLPTTPHHASFSSTPNHTYSDLLLLLASFPLQPPESPPIHRIFSPHLPLHLPPTPLKYPPIDLQEIQTFYSPHPPLKPFTQLIQNKVLFLFSAINGPYITVGLFTIFE